MDLFVMAILGFFGLFALVWFARRLARAGKTTYVYEADENGNEVVVEKEM